VLALIKRYRELFAIGALLLVPLVTYLAESKRGRDLNRFDRAVLWVVSPVERAVTSVVGGAVDRWGDWVALRAVRQDNLSLRRENLALKNQIAQLVEQGAENERLRKMVGFAEAVGGPVITATIIGEAPVMNLLTLKIGKGTRDGVQKGMAVAAPEGIVGRVLSASTSSADVLLLADANSAVPVRVQRSRARAKVMGQGARARPVLAQALRADDVQEGDALVTAGTDGIFPKGLVVGRVTNVVRPNQGLFLNADVVPAVDASRLEEVFVLTTLPGREDLPEASLPRP
jgi:rod shape-determining protein MreC